MLTLEQNRFYNRWADKVANMPSDSVEECIDKYVSCFIIFNSLYNLIPLKVSAGSGLPIPRFPGDKLASTRDVISYSSAIAISECLDGNAQDIIDLYDSLHHFNIKLDTQGNPVPAKDIALKTDILSHNLDTKILALLNIIYYVRCNVVHGRKGLNQYQTLLLQPLINILSQINIFLYQRLSANPY